MHLGALCSVKSDREFFLMGIRVDWPVTKHLNAPGQAEYKGRALLFLMSKQILDPFSWRIWHTKSSWKWILKMTKLCFPKEKRG
jgi:hypothetical protein